MLGHPIVSAEEVIALSQDDLFARWQPGRRGRFVTLAHPAHGTAYPELAPPAMFGGYPLALSATGAVIADDQVSPFLAAIEGFPTAKWHRDIMSTLGVPAVHEDVLFTNVGGTGALAAMAAIDLRSGSSLWEYAPRGIPTEPLTMTHANTKRKATVMELQNIATAMSTKGKGSKPQLPETVLHFSSTPTIDSIHGHWRNPGLVVADGRVLGQVGVQIVVLKQRTGESVWMFALEANERAHSIVASKNHLLASLDRRIVALRLDTGKLEWAMQTPRGGTISLSNGRVLLAMGSPKSTETEGGTLLAFESDEEK